MLHWRLLATSTRLLLALTGAALVIAIVLAATGARITFLVGIVIILFLASLILRRRDLTRAIARELQREADEADGPDQEQTHSF